MIGTEVKVVSVVDDDDDDNDDEIKKIWKWLLL